MDDSSSEASESSSDPPSEYFRVAYCLRIRPQYFHEARLCQNLSRCSAWQARVLLRFEITAIEALLGSIALSHRILLFSYTPLPEGFWRPEDLSDGSFSRVSFGSEFAVENSQQDGDLSDGSFSRVSFGSEFAVENSQQDGLQFPEDWEDGSEPSVDLVSGQSPSPRSCNEFLHELLQEDISDRCEHLSQATAWGPPELSAMQLETFSLTMLWGHSYFAWAIALGAAARDPAAERERKFEQGVSMWSRLVMRYSGCCSLYECVAEDLSEQTVSYEAVVK
eukprot:s539_g1.t1